MKHLYFFKKTFLLILLFIYQFNFGQGQETFTNINTSSGTSYITRTWTGDDGSTWTSTNSRTSGADVNGSASVGLNDDKADTYVESGTISGGIGSITLSFKQIFGGTDTGSLTVYINNSSVGTVTYTGDENSAATTMSINNINIIGDFVIKIANDIGGSSGGGDNRIAIDDVIWTGFATTNPTVGFNTNTSSETETDATFNTTIPVTLANYDADVTVSIAVDAGSTAEPADYLLNTSSLLFTADGSQNISLDINDDADSDNETIILNLTVSSGTATISNSQHTITISDDDLPNIIISEIMYNTPGTDDEWIELYNNEGIDLDISDWILEYNGNTYTFPTTTSFINNTFITIAVGSNGDGTYNNDNPFTPDYNNLSVTNDVVKDEFLTNELGNSSGTIILKNNLGSTIDTVTYDDGDVNSTDGSGNTYEISNIEGDNSSTGNNWQASTNSGGSAGRASSATWIGVTDNNWATITNWANDSAPLSSSDVIIPSGKTFYPTTSSAIAFNSLIIESGATLIADATVTGTVTYNRNISDTNFHILSSPVSGETIQNIRTNQSLASGTGTNIGLGEYQSFDNTWEYATDVSTGSINLGEGYAIKLTTAEDVSFTGTLNTANVDINTTSNVNNSFNLLGNPFTAYINSATFLNTHTTSLEEQTIWLWNGTTYETKNVDDAFEIAPGQGFFIEANGANTLTLDTGNQSHQITNIVLKQEAITNFELQINNGENSSSTEIRFIEGKTTGFDNGSDSKMFGGIEEKFAVFTELLTDNDGRKLAIQTLPTDNTIAIPVGLIANTDEEITFSIETVNLPEDTTLYLEDKATGDFINLSENSYKTTLENDANGIGQFYIHTAAKSLSNEEITKNLNNVSIYKSSKTQVTIAGLNTNADLSVFSLLGKQVVKTSISSNGVSKVDLPNLSAGVYIVKLNSKYGEITKKITLN